MKAYEYIRLELDMGDLSTLNDLGYVGWKIVAFVNDKYAILEREFKN